MAINNHYLVTLRLNYSERFIVDTVPIYKDHTLYEWPNHNKLVDYFQLILKKTGIVKGQAFNYTSLINTSYASAVSLDKISNYNDRFLVKNYLDAYFIGETYKKCIKDHQVIAYSHRKIGWNKYEFSYQEVLTISILTNFGFGSANYFYLRIQFKNIELVKYSHLVKYKILDATQLLNNTRIYAIEDNSWKDCFEFIRDVCNDFSDLEETSFIQKYIVGELEILTTELSRFLTSESFELILRRDINNNCTTEKVESVTFSNYELTIFRGEKISEALKFVKQINKLSAVIDAQSYIDKITDYCCSLIPEISSALNSIREEIIDQELLNDMENKKLFKADAALNRVNNLMKKEDERMERLLLTLEEKSPKDYNRIASIIDESRLRSQNNSSSFSKKINQIGVLNNKVLKRIYRKWVVTLSNYYSIKFKYEKQKEKYLMISNNLHNSLMSQRKLENFEISIKEYLNNL